MIRNLAILFLPPALLAGALLLPSPYAPVAALLWGASGMVALSGLLRPRSGVLARNFWRAPPQPRVALTFDDGPHPEDTPAILRILEESGVKATFFFIGREVRSRPELVRLVAEAGHGIGAHSDTHPWWFSLALPARLRREVRGSAGAIESVTGRPVRLFRPPMGHKNAFLGDELAAAGMEQVSWSARPYDSLGGPPERICSAALARVAPGGILLLHEGVRRVQGLASPTVAALPGIINGLRARGIEPTRLEDLMEATAAPGARAASS